MFFEKFTLCAVKLTSILLNIYNLYLVFNICHSYLYVILYFIFNYFLKICIISNNLNKSGAVSDTFKISDMDTLNDNIIKSVENTRHLCIIFDLLIFIGLNCFILI